LSDSSSSILEESSIYIKKSINKDSFNNKNRIRSISVNSNSANNKPKIKSNTSNLIQKKLTHNLYNSINLNTIKKENEKTKEKDVGTQSAVLLDNFLKEANARTNKKIEPAGKTFSGNFFTKYSGKKTVNNLKKYFGDKKPYLNGDKDIQDNIKNEKKINFNFYWSKRPLDKENTFFRKRTENLEVNPNIIDENKKFIFNKKEKEEKKTINSTENTIFDDDDEQRGRNVPH